MSNSLTGYAFRSRDVIVGWDFRILTAFAVIYVVWGSTYLAVSVALSSIPPFLLMGSRSVVGGLILFALGRRRRATQIPSSLWLTAGACGLLLFVGCHGVMAFAQQRVPSGMTAIILATIPFWIAILAFIVPAGKKPARLRTLALLAPGMAGVALIAWNQTAASNAGIRLFDLGLLLWASLAWAIGSIVLEWNSAPGVSAFTISGMALLVGGIALLAVSAAAGEFPRFTFAGLSIGSAVAWSYLVVAGTVVTFGSYIWLLERVSPPLVATYTFVNPIIAVLLGWAFLGESFTAATLIGGALVVAAIIGLVIFDQRPNESETEGEPVLPAPLSKGSLQ
jgi:drug/metabolite transporter (DMT)-like permease